MYLPDNIFTGLAKDNFPAVVLFSSVLGMLLIAIPASVSGLKAVIRQELQSRGLPLDLLQLVSINGEWLYCFEKPLILRSTDPRNQP